MSTATPSQPTPPPPGPREGTRPPAWKLALAWTVLSMLGVVAVLPYQLALLPAEPPPPLPLPVLMALASVQTGVMAFLLAWAGTAAGRTLGVGSPLMEAVLSGQRPRLGRSLGVAALLGALVALTLLGLDALFAPLMPALKGAQPPQPTPWQGLLASLYGGVTEEVLTRLGLATLLAWGASRVLGGAGRGRTLSLGVGITGAALLFGALHLPTASLLWPLTSTVVARTLLLNSIMGVVAGVLYVRRGLEHAMLAHLCADLMLHVLVPALRGG